MSSRRQGGFRIAPSPLGFRGSGISGGALAACLFVVVLALSGGTSRWDAASQVVVRSGAVCVIACAIVARGSPFENGALRPAFGFMIALAALIAAQLVPLPPDLWLSLPGRAHYAEAAAMFGQPQPWRPLNLTPDLGWNALLALLPGAAVMTLAGLAREREARLGPILFIVVATVSALLGIAQLAGGPESGLRYYDNISIGSPTGFLANRNHHAMLLACALPVVAYWTTDDGGAVIRGHWRSLTGLVVTLGLVLVIAASGSRAGLMLGVVGVTTAAAIVWPRIAAKVVRRDRRIWLTALAGGAILIVAAAIALYRDERLLAVNRLLTADASLDMRQSWLVPAQRIVRDFFPWGSGFGSFDPVFRQYEPFALLRYTYANQLHNEYVQLALEAGLPGLLLAAAGAVAWGLQCIRIVRAPASRARVLASIGALASAMLAAASAFDYPLRTPLLSGVFVLAITWMLAIEKDGGAGKRPAE